MEEHDHVSTTRSAYDATAEAYARLVGTEVTPAVEAAIDRALLAWFVELVASPSAGPVADLGCGPGRVAGYLAARGLDAVGVDLSLAMLTVARRAHATIPFVEGRLDALPLADRSLAGGVCWYSLIHTPPPHLAAACAELARVLAPAAPLLLAFQAGAGEPVRRTELCGKDVSVTIYRHAPDAVARCLGAAGLALRARIVREPELEHESGPQAFVVACAGDGRS